MPTAIRRSRKISGSVGAAVLFLTLTACTQDHLTGRDTVTTGVGDAMAVNTALQTRDTMPASARRSDLKYDANRLNKALERYRDPTTAKGAEGEQEISTTQ